MKRIAAFLCCALGFITAGQALAADSWVLTYHNANTRHGLYDVGGLTTAAAATVQPDTKFHASFSGNVYAQPLYWKPAGKTLGLLIVATEGNLILGINAETGATVWQTQLPASVTSSELPCGNINPEGVTGTPVIDSENGRVYFDALVETTSGPRQMIYALFVTTGKIVPGWPVNLQSALSAKGIGFDSTTQGQRSAVLFFQGSLYIDYAARSGDCGTYHGIVVQIQAANHAIEGYWATRGDGGGIWAQGGAASDGDNLFITTGNTFNANNDWSDGEAILRLKPGLAHSLATKDYFTPANWQSLDNSDADLGSTEALPLTVGGKARLIAMGKDGNAYLVSRVTLGGIGAQIATAKVSNNGIITAPAVYNTTTSTLVAFTSYSGLSCSGTNITMLSVTSDPTTPITVKWCATFNGRGAPIITTSGSGLNPIVWVVGAEGDNRLHAFDANTGAVLYAGGTGTAMRRPAPFPDTRGGQPAHLCRRRQHHLLVRLLKGARGRHSRGEKRLPRAASAQPLVPARLLNPRAGLCLLAEQRLVEHPLVGLVLRVEHRQHRVQPPAADGAHGEFPVLLLNNFHHGEASENNARKRWLKTPAAPRGCGPYVPIRQRNAENCQPPIQITPPTHDIAAHSRDETVSHDTLLHRLVRPSARIAGRTRLQPNHVTGARILTAFLSAAEYARGTEQGIWIGSGLFVVSALLDRADGELARSTGRTSPAGHRLDLVSDFLSNATVFLGLGLGAREGWLQGWAPILGVIAAFSVAAVVWCMNRPGVETSAESRRLFDPDDMMLGVPLLACTAGPVPILLLAGTVTPLAALVLFYTAPPRAAAKLPGLSPKSGSLLPTFRR